MISPKTVRAFLLLFILTGLLIGEIGFVSAQDSANVTSVSDPGHKKATILVLHSYYSTYEWSNDITKGVMYVLDNSEYRDADIYFEYMDAKRHPEPEYIVSLSEVYSHKYDDPEQFDLIIVSDNHAIDFLTSEAGLEIFPLDIPVVFCGANDFDPAWLEKRPNMTGVIESIEPSETLDLILKFHPDTKNLLVISDHNTHTSRIVTEQTKQAFAPYNETLDIHYLEDMTAAQMQETVASVSNDTVIFLLLFNRDRAGNEVTMMESIEMVASSSKVPVYSAWDFYLGKGIVGGKLTSAFNDGRLAGELGVRVLDGEDPASIPVQDSKYHDFLFDWEQLERFSISGDELPEGSIIANRVPTLYELYKTEMLVTAIVIVFLLSVVSFLLINQNRLKDTQAQLLAAKEKAEEADKLKSVFIANVSHELRTPLNGILGFSEMMKMSNISTEKKLHYADVINTSGKQLLGLINNILDISSIEAGKVTVRKTEFDVNEMLLELYSMFRPQFEINKPGVDLIFNQDTEDENFFIYSDKQMIRQILTNLLGNALKFTQDGIVEFGYSMPDHNTIQFYVKDTGIGIPQERYDCVFGRFKQVDDGSSRQYEGTGLGMSISKGLAQLLGGDIEFESEVGVGSVFYLRVPHVRRFHERDGKLQ